MEVAWIVPMLERFIATDRGFARARQERRSQIRRRSRTDQCQRSTVAPQVSLNATRLRTRSERRQRR
ncbi:DUF2274 domain-containing protein [Mesorhizobium sp.]|uniref:DUF2274 domain-containing protein n=1 Tax=Mesorhizobium sp. TaxID=1871066 RepID=UPI00356A7FAD